MKTVLLLLWFNGGHTQPLMSMLVDSKAECEAIAETVKNSDEYKVKNYVLVAPPYKYNWHSCLEIKR